MSEKKLNHVTGTGAILLPERKLLSCKSIPLRMVDCCVRIGEKGVKLVVTGEKNWLSWTADVNVSIWLLPTEYSTTINDVGMQTEPGWLGKLCTMPDAIKLSIFEHQKATGGMKEMEFHWDLSSFENLCAKNRILVFHVEYEKMPFMLKKPKRELTEETPLLL
jgi:hypothetical protein